MTPDFFFQVFAENRLIKSKYEEEKKVFGNSSVLGVF